MGRLYNSNILCKVTLRYFQSTILPQSALMLRPLRITESEAFEVDKAAHPEALSRLAVEYDNAVGVGKFWTANETVQTVIADMAFQFGQISAKHPQLWNDIVHNDWQQLSADLKAETNYTERRHLEAGLLDNALNSGLLHQGSRC